MSDREVILDFLRKAERRIRSNKRFNEIATTLAAALLVPVLFKILDLFFLFRGRTVTAFFTIWALATLVWIVFRLRGKSPLSQIAGNIDSKAQLNDQLKTAFWFIQNPRDSEWVNVQIHRTARETGRLRLKTIFPRRFPRTSFVVASLLFLLVALNFVPLSLNHNWLKLEAAPPFQLTALERASLENALKLLDRAKATENAQLAEKIENLIQDLEQGNISVDEAIKQLGELQDELEAGDLDAANMTNGIAQMASILRQAKALQSAAQPMAQGKLLDAATQIRDLDGRLDALSPADLREMSEKLLEASERPRGGLQDLASAFENTGGALRRGDRSATHSGLDRISKELENLAQQLADQQLRSEAGDEIGDLIDGLQQNEQEGAATAQNGKPNSSNQGKAGQKNGGQGEGEPGQAQDDGSGNSQEAAQGEQPGGQGDESEKSGQAGDNPGGTSADMPNGKGGNSFGGSTQSAPLEGEETSLEVQLQKEALKLEESEGGQEPDKELEAAGERERSKLDYRNAPSNLTPAQKDLLSQDRIPWESRQLIKNYFQAVKPKQTK
jgi:hypothetical protein